MPSLRIQLALDTPDLAAALRPALACGHGVDIVEAGTVLILNEGMSAVRALRAAFPTHPLVADIRIARAGAKFASMAFVAGADRVTVIGESGPSVIRGAASAASDHGGEVEVELPATWIEADVLRYVEAGARHLVAHRFQGGPLAEDAGIQDTLSRLAALDLGPAGVTLAGGISQADTDTLQVLAFDTLAVGSAIVGSDNPAGAVAALRSRLGAGQTTGAVS